MHLLTNATIGRQRLNIGDLRAALGSGFAPRRLLMERYFHRRRVIFDDDAIAVMLGEEEQALGATIEEFPERAKQFALMANIATMHGMRAVGKTYVRGAAANLLAYSHRKDMLLFRLLDAIRACYQSDDLGKNQSRSWLFRLAPMIGGVLEFTDGDETRHLINELGDALAEMQSELLPSYYDYLCDERHYGFAAGVIRTVLAEVDLTDPFTKALAETATDAESLVALKRRADSGDHDASDCFERARTFFGEPYVDKSGSGGSSEVAAPQEETVSAASAPPGALDDFLKESRSVGDWRGRNAILWLDYWDGVGRGRDALAAMEVAIDRGATFDTFSGVLDRVAALALKYNGKAAAYPWLVKAQVHSNGWAAYFTDTKAAKERLELVVHLFPEKWFEFIRDSVFNALAAGWRSSAVWGEFLTLVEFCIAAKQLPLARGITESTLTFAESLCSPVQLPKPAWIPRET